MSWLRCLMRSSRTWIAVAMLRNAPASWPTSSLLRMSTSASRSLSALEAAGGTGQLAQRTDDQDARQDHQQQRQPGGEPRRRQQRRTLQLRARLVLARERERRHQHADDLALDVVHGRRRHHAIGVAAQLDRSGTWVTISGRPRLSSAIRRVIRPVAIDRPDGDVLDVFVAPEGGEVSRRSAGSSKTTEGAHESANSRVTALALSSLARSRLSR